MKECPSCGASSNDRSGGGDPCTIEAHAESCELIKYPSLGTYKFELDHDQEELKEEDVERQVEEFRRKMESLTTAASFKMKPNISSEWLRDLR